MDVHDILDGRSSEILELFYNIEKINANITVMRKHISRRCAPLSWGIRTFANYCS